jgi:thiamine-monophosphate kinase
VNEFDIIRRLSEGLPPPPPEVIVPVGDDCAVLRFAGDGLWVVAADMLVSERHFKEEWASPGDVGYKAVAVNVSDVAAMGGRPRFVLASGGAPDPETTLRCMEGVARACEDFGAYPVGGDTTGAGALTVDVAILGELEGEPMLRSAARPGDLLAVTGELGAAAAGLLALEEGELGLDRLVRKHLRPEPRVALGLTAARLGVRVAIDLSDGLASDVRRVCEASGVGARVDLNRLPIAGDTREYVLSRGLDPDLLAATGGEDYELLFAAPEEVVRLLTAEPHVPVTMIGDVVTGNDVLFLRDGDLVGGLSGWDHFGGA